MEIWVSHNGGRKARTSKFLSESRSDSQIKSKSKHPGAQVGSKTIGYWSSDCICKSGFGFASIARVYYLTPVEITDLLCHSIFFVHSLGFSTEKMKQRDIMRSILVTF